MNPVRRVVTGHDEKDVAKVLWDDAIAKTKRGKSGVLTHLWNTDETAGRHSGWVRRSSIQAPSRT